jgi:ABC-2 type transport system ATP-binding protein
MWRLIAKLRDDGVTIILTTHYIEEAQEMADRVGVIDRGRLQLVEEKRELMERLGRTEARIALAQPLEKIPDELDAYQLSLEEGGSVLSYHGKGEGEVAPLLKALLAAGVDFTGLDVRESSLEDIFVDLVGHNHANDGEEAR